MESQCEKGFLNYLVKVLIWCLSIPAHWLSPSCLHEEAWSNQSDAWTMFQSVELTSNWPYFNPLKRFRVTLKSKPSSPNNPGIWRVLSNPYPKLLFSKHPLCFQISLSYHLPSVLTILFRYLIQDRTWSPESGLTQSEEDYNSQIIVIY